MKILQTVISIVAVWALCCPCGPVTGTSYAMDVKDIVAEAQSIQNDNKQFQITILPERESGTYKPGDEIALMFKSNRDAYLNIIDIGTSGNVRLIFPNAWHKSNKVEKNKTYRIPPKDANFIFRVTPPAGINYVKAIATLKKCDCVKEKYLEAKGEFSDIKEPLMAIKDIQAELRKVDAKNWTEASAKIVIEEGQPPAKPAGQPLKPVEEAKPTKPEEALKPIEEPRGETKDIVAEVQKIRNEGKEFKIKLWTEGDKASYMVEEPVTFMFSADRDCYVTLIDIGTSGKVHRLFPNKMHESNKVEKGKTYAIPPDKSDFLFRVKGPEGTEYVKAIATLQPLKSLEKTEMEGKGYFSEIRDPKLVVKDIGLELALQDTKNWAEAEASLKIVSKEAASPMAPSPSKIKLSTEKQTYNVGEPISFSFQCEQDCNLTLIDIGSSGKVHIIFPNKYNKDSALKAGTAYRIPLVDNEAPIIFKVVSPPGPNTVKAICTFKPCKLFSSEISFDDQTFPLLGNKEEILKQIRAGLEGLGSPHFAETDLTVEIME